MLDLIKIGFLKVRLAEMVRLGYDVLVVRRTDNKRLQAMMPELEPHLGSIFQGRTFTRVLNRRQKCLFIYSEAKNS